MQLCYGLLTVNYKFSLVRSRGLEFLALWLKEPPGQVTLILKVSSFRHFYARHRDFSHCNFCTLCRILQVRVPIASLETVQKQCRNSALILGQIKNDDFNHRLDGSLSDHKGKIWYMGRRMPTRLRRFSGEWAVLYNGGFYMPLATSYFKVATFSWNLPLLA